MLERLEVHIWVHSCVCMFFLPNVTALVGSATPGVSDSSDSPPTSSSIGYFVATLASSYSCLSTPVISTEYSGYAASEGTS